METGIVTIARTVASAGGTGISRSVWGETRRCAKTTPAHTTPITAANAMPCVVRAPSASSTAGNACTAKTSAPIEPSDSAAAIGAARLRLSTSTNISPAPRASHDAREYVR